MRPSTFRPKLNAPRSDTNEMRSVLSVPECSSIYVLSLFYIQIWILFSRQPAALDGWNEWMYKWICFGMACLSSAPVPPLPPPPYPYSPRLRAQQFPFLSMHESNTHAATRSDPPHIQHVTFRSTKERMYEIRKNLKFLMRRVCVFFFTAPQCCADIYNKHPVN